MSQGEKHAQQDQGLPGPSDSRSDTLPTDLSGRHRDTSSLLNEIRGIRREFPSPIQAGRETYCSNSFTLSDAVLDPGP